MSEMYELLGAGLANIAHVKYLVPLFFGTLAGVLGGALPGVTITMTIIVVLPFTFGLFIVGHLSGDLRNFDQIVDSETAARLARGLYWILPNLAQFDVKDRVVHGIAVPFGYMTLTFGYAALYIAMLLSLSMYIFSKRDFK